jgi:hypothetical protein
MTDLITIAREYLEGATTSEISDDVIERLLNKSRQYVHDKQIIAEDYYYDNVSRVYKIGYCYLMNLVLTDGNNSIIDNTSYEIDVFSGIITFDGSPLVIPDTIYATFNFYNFFMAVADCWLYLAAKSRFETAPKLGDESLPEDRSSRAYCIRKYWTYCPSENIQMTRI